MKTDWDWSQYYDGTPEDREYQTLTAALDYWGDRDPGYAVDLGCGQGMDTVRLLAEGWNVLAVDATVEGLERLEQRSDLPENGVLTTECSTFQAFAFPESVDLITSSYALPFCDPRDFLSVWDKIKAALKPGGVFCGHFFGDRDSWVKHGLSVFSESNVKEMLAGLQIHYFDERDEDAPVVDGRIKHWHVFGVAAFRP